MPTSFQNELSYLRDIGRELVQLNPRLAPYFARSSTDPDVAHLLEGFAFLTSRANGEIDDEMSAFTENIISMTCPNFLRPFPATTFIKFSPVDKAITTRQGIPAHSVIHTAPTATKTIEYSFTTTHSCSIYPLEIRDVQLLRSQAKAALEISFETLSDRSLAEIGLDDLRLTLTGEAASKQTLFLWLGRYLEKVYMRFPDGSRRMIEPQNQMRPAGMDFTEALLPDENRLFDGHRLLREFFSFPDKFYGYDLTGLASVVKGQTASDFDLVFEFNHAFPREISVGFKDVTLFCVPAVNLSAQDSQQVTFDEPGETATLNPAGFKNTTRQIFSVTGVTTVSNDTDKNDLSRTRIYQPYAAFVHDGSSEEGDVYYRLKRQERLQSHDCDYKISFCRHDGAPAKPDENAISAGLLCYNTNAEQLNIGEICTSTDTLPAFVQYHNITRPTAVIYPPQDSSYNWSVISGLSLHYTSLQMAEVISGILQNCHHRSFYDRQEDRQSRQKTGSILSLKTRPVDRLFSGRPIRGLQSDMTIDDSAFETLGEVYLFGTILSHFFAMSTTVHSFHRLAVYTTSGETFDWPVRTGTQTLI